MEDFIAGRYEAGTSNIMLKNGKKIGEEPLTTGWNNTSHLIENVASGKITSKADEIPYYHTDYKTAQKMSQGMYNTNYVGSGLMTGTQWDVMLKWMSTQNDYSDVKANSNWGNYINVRTFTDCTGKYLEVDTKGSSSKGWIDSDGTNNKGAYTILTTGATNETRKKNIYDVAGNLWEWTEESGGTAGAFWIIRGGSCTNGYSDSPACYRYRFSVNDAHTPIGFRPVLYIK